MSKHLAIMTAPKYGMRDMNSPAFWFSVKYGDELIAGALIIKSAIEMAKIVKEGEVYNVAQLKDHPCQIEEHDGMIEFIKVLKP